MAYQDFRQFLEALRRHGELIDIDRFIALNDVGKVMKQSYRREGPAIQFNRNGTDYPLVAGLYSTRSKALLAFETDEKGILPKVLAGLDHPIAPELSSRGACHDVVIAGDDVDITRFPIPRYSPADGGPYITPGIVVSKDPETGIPDVGHYRFMILGRDTFSFSAQPFHRFGKISPSAEGASRPGRAGDRRRSVIAYLPVQVTDTTNDWEVAGGGAPVELVKCRMRPRSARHIGSGDRVRSRHGTP
jgi:4-hydroxy-3-polyprenylbenzoate decarboxylase/2,5-furandicarboxylate decarboxylase 1